MLVGTGGPDTAYQSHRAFDAWSILTPEIRSLFPESTATDALIKALEAEEQPRAARPNGPKVLISGRLAQPETNDFLNVLAESPVPEGWGVVVQLEGMRRRAEVERRKPELWRELFTAAERASSEPGDLGDVATLYLANCMSDVARVRGSRAWRENDFEVVLSRVNQMKDDTQFAYAVELLVNRDDPLADEQLLDRMARLLDRGWPLGPSSSIAVHGANQAIRLGDPDRAAEWVGRVDALLEEQCRAQHPNCADARLTLGELFGHLALLDDVTAPTLHSAIVQAVWGCDERYPLHPGKHTLSLPELRDADPTLFSRCVEERYQRSECAKVIIEVIHH